MLITKSQGLACRRAAERIARGAKAYVECQGSEIVCPLKEIGWFTDGLFDLAGDGMQNDYDQSQVLLALLWCATIAGEA